MLNKVILIGNIGKDPEIKEFESGSIANFSVATNETYKNRDGERVTQTEWHNIRIGIPGLVKLVSQYFKKGDPIYLEGKIKTRSYEADGQKKFFTEIHVDAIKFLPKSKTDGSGGGSSNGLDDFAVNNDATEDDFPI